MTEKQIQSIVRQFRDMSPDDRAERLKETRLVAWASPVRNIREAALALLPYLIESEAAEWLAIHEKND